MILRATSFALMMLLPGCAASGGVPAPEGEPLVVGLVESVVHTANASSVHVAAGAGSREQCGIVATADGGTRYLRREGGELREASREEVAEGVVVEVYVDGPVMESCPVQGRAAAFVIADG